MKKTKIIATLGPASQTKEVLTKMTEAGMDVVRLNFSHGTHEDYAVKIKTIKEVRDEKQIPLPILPGRQPPGSREKRFHCVDPHVRKS